MTLLHSCPHHRFNPYHDPTSGEFTFGPVKVATPGSTYDKLTGKGQKAVDDWMHKYGVTWEQMSAELHKHLNIPAGKVWYKEAQAYAHELAVRFGVSDEVATAVISATSPQTNWERNKVIAERVLANFSKYKGIAYKDAAVRIGGGLSDNLAQGLQVIDTGNPNWLTGVKRRSFYNNMGWPEYGDDVTCDGWMAHPLAHIIGVPPSKVAGWFSKGVKATGLEGYDGPHPAYIVTAEAVRQLAAELNLVPSAAQAAYWVPIRELKGACCKAVANA